MAIPDDKIKLYRESTDNEFKGEQLNIPEDEKDSFWAWFQKSAEIFKPESLDLLEETQYKGICFDIAQKSCKNKNIEYCEGFLTLGNEPIYHGFNLKNNKVIDFTAKKYLNDYKTMNLGKLPSDYCGVKIPDKFIESENSKYLEGDSINIPPLLYRYFKSKE